MVTNDQLLELTNRSNKLKAYLEIEKKVILIQNEEEKIANPDFWNKPKEAELTMKNLRALKKWVQDYNTINNQIEELEILLEYYKEAAQQYFDNQAQTEANQVALEQEQAEKLAAEQARKASIKAKQEKQVATKQASAKRKAAAPVKRANTKSVTDYLDDSDEAFDDWYKQLQDTM